MATTRSVKPAATTEDPAENKAISFRPTQECRATLEEAEKVTGKNRTFLIDQCLTNHLPVLVQDLLNKRSNPLLVKGHKKAA